MSKEQKMITTPEEAAAAVGRDGRQLKFVPDNLKTPELCMQAVMDTWGAALKDVPERMRTPELCMQAVRFGDARRELAIKHVPDALKTEALCMTAVKACGRALEFVPEELKTPDLCLKAAPSFHFVGVTTHTGSVEPDPGNEYRSWGDSGFPFVPDALKTPGMCAGAVYACPNAEALGLVPDSMKTEEMCLYAVRFTEGRALKHVPERLRTPDIVQAAEDARIQGIVERAIGLY